MYCAGCGQDLAVDTKFCSVCGKATGSDMHVLSVAQGSVPPPRPPLPVAQVSVPLPPGVGTNNTPAPLPKQPVLWLWKEAGIVGCVFIIMFIGLWLFFATTGNATSGNPVAFFASAGIVGKLAFAYFGILIFRIMTSPSDPTAYERALKAGLQYYLCPGCQSAVILGENLCHRCGLKQR